MARFAAILDQDPPPEHDVLGDGENPLLEGRSYRMREPIVQFGSSARIGDELDAEADFRKGYDAGVKQIEWLRSDERDHLRFGGIM